jgi:hypothetical protein
MPNRANGLYVLLTRFTAESAHSLSPPQVSPPTVIPLPKPKGPRGNPHEHAFRNIFYPSPLQ